MTSLLMLMLIFIGLMSKGLSLKSYKDFTDIRIQTNEYNFDPAKSQNDFLKTLSRARRQQPGSGCVIPQTMAIGTYSVLGNLIANEGELVPHHSILILTCPPGYVVSNSGVNFCDEMKNDWFEELPTCMKMCKPPKSLTVEFICTIPSKNGQTTRESCDMLLPPGTIATPKCRNGHHSITSSKSISCIDGRWALSMPSCTAECGKVTPHGTPNVINGTDAKRGEFPWHVAIYSTYKTDKDNPEIWCGGSILSTSIVISAAHCFYNPLTRTSLDADLFSIAVGKLFSKFSHPEEAMDPFIQKSEVERIEIPEDYQGVAASYSHDLALLVLRTPLTFSNLIMPICINLVDKDFDDEQTSPGLDAMIAGFGLVDVNGLASDVLKTAVLPIISKSKCKKDSPPEFEKYIVWDKICAGHLTGIGVCKGDSGGGLVVRTIERNHATWYLRGIVSTAPESEHNDKCSTNTYSTFTKPFPFKEFIEDVIDKQGCKMPGNPPNGRFRLAGAKNAYPGQGVGHKSQLVLKCDDGYAPTERENNVCDEFINDWIKDLATCELVRVTERPYIKNGCVIPSHPKNGQFVVLMGASDQSAGDIVPPFTLMSLTCASGYSTGSEIISCGSDGYWASNLGTCEKLCNTLVSLSVRFSCAIPVNGKPNLTSSCDNPLPSGSIATPYCEDGHFSTERLHTLTCKDGYWDRPIPTCSATCGKSTADSLNSLERKTRKYALKGEFPWNVALNYVTMDSIMFLCGGTILSRLHVITSAHCFDVHRDISGYVVSVGKLYTDFNDTEEIHNTYIQKLKVKRIEIPITYEGERRTSFDLAIMILETQINYSAYVMPICLDLQNVALNNNQLRDGSLARVSGFGYETPKGPQAPQLKALTMPIYSLTTCKQILPMDVYVFLGVDKICAGVVNGTNLCLGDSGIALAVSDKGEDGETLWYMRALASYVPSTFGECDIRSPAIFTEVFGHKYFIESVLNGPV